MPKALVTGASSGIGEELARQLSKKYGYDLVIVGRDEKRLQNLANSLSTNCEIIIADLTKHEELMIVSSRLENDYFDVFINNAGFGLEGSFLETDLAKEQNMIDLNIKAMHTLFKSSLKSMKRQNRGFILNTGSIAGHLDGPFMSTYHATKHYVRSLTYAVRQELKKEKIPIKITLLSPGPVKTRFFETGEIYTKRTIGFLSSEQVASYTLPRLFKGKSEIIPGFLIRLLRFSLFFVPSSIQRRIIAFVYAPEGIKNKRK